MYGKEYNGISIDKKLNKYTCIENNKYLIRIYNEPCKFA